MKVKETLFPFIIIPVGIAFVAVCTLVYINRGKNVKLITAKLKIGAFILSFSWFVVSGCSYDTCYVTTELENRATIKPVEIYNPGDSVIGNINNTSFQFYSFKLVDSVTVTAKQAGYLADYDNNSGNYRKDFFLLLDNSITAGVYSLEIYGEVSDSPKYTNLINRFRILVNN